MTGSAPPLAVSAVSTLPEWQGSGDVDHGKESRKLNQDCTICRPCRYGIPDSTVAKSRANRPKWREADLGIRSRLENQSLATSAAHPVATPLPFGWRWRPGLRACATRVSKE